MKQPVTQNHPIENDRVADLGRVLDHFPSQDHTIKRWVPLIFGILMILFAITFTTNLIFRMWSAIQFHGRAILLSVIPFPTVYYALMFVGGGIMLSLVRVHWSDSITLFETGFVKYTMNRVCIWPYASTQRFDNHIKRVIFGGSIISTRVNIIVENSTHKRWVIQNDYIRMDDLIHLLRLNILPGLVKRARQHLADGETFKFHKYLQAIQRGLIINGDLSAYEHIEPMIDNNIIKLRQKGKPEAILFKSNISSITNLDLLLDLLKSPPNQTY